jgi:hypothetical protein
MAPGRSPRGFPVHAAALARLALTEITQRREHCVDVVVDAIARAAVEVVGE